LLRFRHRFFNANHPNAGDWLAILRRIFVADIFIIIAWQHDATSDEHLIYVLDSKNKGRMAEFSADIV